MDKIVKWILIAFLMFIAFRMVQFGYRVATKPPSKPVPGDQELMDATSHLTKMASQQRLADGNSNAATELASSFGPVLQEITEKAFTGGRPGLAEMYKQKKIAVYCELRDTQCAFLVSVPELRNYTSDALAALKEFAWLAAQQTVATSKLKNKDIDLAVALRGAIFYGPIQIGRSTGPATTQVEGMSGMKSMHPFFALPETTPATGSAPAAAAPATKVPKSALK